VELERVGKLQRDVAERGQHLAEPLLELPIDLDHVYVAGARGEPLGQDPRTAADLEHDVRRLERGQSLDHVEDVAVDQEVLAELVGATPTAHHPSNEAALRSTAASNSRYGTRR